MSFHPPVLLDRRPSDDHRTRLVLIFYFRCGATSQPEKGEKLFTRSRRGQRRWMARGRTASSSQNPVGRQIGAAQGSTSSSIRVRRAHGLVMVRRRVFQAPHVVQGCHRRAR